MALSRIWSAFIIVAIVVAVIRSIAGDEQIFSRMVVGKADDPYDSVSYVMIGQPEKSGYASKESFVNQLASYGYILKDSLQQASVVIAGEADLAAA